MDQEKRNEFCHDLEKQYSVGGWNRAHGWGGFNRLLDNPYQMSKVHFFLVRLNLVWTICGVLAGGFHENMSKQFKHFFQPKNNSVTVQICTCPPLSVLPYFLYDCWQKINFYPSSKNNLRSQIKQFLSKKNNFYLKKTISIHRQPINNSITAQICTCPPFSVLPHSNLIEYMIVDK